jgi:SAM-dependent methyltransferase
MLLKNPERFPSNVQYGDIVKGLPLKAGVCSGVYCSHVLEHLSLEDARIALRNSRLILRPGGVFRLVLPDLALYIKTYTESRSSDAASRFMRDSMLGKVTRSRGVVRIAREMFGGSQHLWMWDFPSLADELRRQGFSSIRRASFGDSDDPMFSFVEENVRWQDCLGVECRSA